MAIGNSMARAPYPTHNPIASAVQQKTAAPKDDGLIANVGQMARHAVCPVRNTYPTRDATARSSQTKSPRSEDRGLMWTDASLLVRSEPQLDRPTLLRAPCTGTWNAKAFTGDRITIPEANGETLPHARGRRKRHGEAGGVGVFAVTAAARVAAFACMVLTTASMAGLSPVGEAAAIWAASVVSNVRTL
jgi:hypothetical protein